MNKVEQKNDNEFIPKVFISYSWTCQKRVIELAERLVDNGIDVKIDIWDLEPGQDVNHFIEQSVADPTINYVMQYSLSWLVLFGDLPVVFPSTLKSPNLQSSSTCCLVL
ncbi:MAG: toll/interleukin-1 receptor domain-containing protein [Candidatus Cloacimonetes bacterium]|nr:toll/interleukin-1 receptor domain-containing protein [Candidatus Cloacimonadota bacterium]